MIEKNTYIKDRCLIFAKKRGIGILPFLKSIDMTYASFKGRAKKTSLNSNALVKIYTKYPEVNIHWLLTGEGEILQNNSNNEVENIEKDNSIKKNTDTLKKLIEIIDSKNQQIINTQAIAIEILNSKIGILKKEQINIHERVSEDTDIRKEAYLNW